VDNADPKLERSTESVRDPLRRASADGRHRRELTYTESNLGPVFSRFDKLAKNYLSFIHFASTVIWLR
jgi:hypothetical protein